MSRWPSWYRWTTLAMLALAFLTIAATEHASPPPDDQIPLTRKEIAALFSTLIIDPVKNARHRLGLAAAPPAPGQNMPLPAASPPTMKITKSG